MLSASCCTPCQLVLLLLLWRQARLQGWPCCMAPLAYCANTAQMGWEGGSGVLRAAHAAVHAALCGLPV